MPAIKFVAQSLRVPLSQAYGVVTFYHFFSLKPPGKHTCTVCLGTACYIKGSDKLVAQTENSSTSTRARPRRTEKFPSPPRAAWARADVPRSSSSMASFPDKLRPRNSRSSWKGGRCNER